MNNRQYFVLTAGLVLMGLSCLFPLWKPSSRDFAFLFSPPPTSTPDVSRLALEWFLLGLVTVVGLIQTRSRGSVTTVYPTYRHHPVDALPVAVLDKWGEGKRKRRIV